MPRAAALVSVTQSSRLRSELRYFVELVALSGFAIAQPILNSTGSAPEHLVFRGVGGSEIVLFAFLVVFVPPLVLYVMTSLVGLISARVRLLAQALVMGVLLV